MDTAKYQELKQDAKVSIQKANNITVLVVSKQYDQHTGKEVEGLAELVQVKPLQDQLVALKKQRVDAIVNIDASIAGIETLLADVEDVLAK